MHVLVALERRGRCGNLCLRMISENVGPNVEILSLFQSSNIGGQDPRSKSSEKSLGGILYPGIQLSSIEYFSIFNIGAQDPRSKNSEKVFGRNLGSRAPVLKY